jgi:DNA-binding NtrC family response regulator
MKTCKVLIVEDDDEILDVLSEIFSGEGYHFTLCRTGAEMRAALASDPEIHIAVIDVVLPDGFHGIRLAEEVAAQGLPVILTSGDHTREAEMMQSGHCHILKPFRIPELLRLIDATLKETEAKCQRKAV